MARFGLAPLFFLAIFTCKATAAEDFNENAIKHDIIKRESLLAAEAIRKIPVCTTNMCKRQLATMANDFVVALQYGTYSLSNLFGNSEDEKVLKLISHKLEKCRDFTSQLQKALPGDSEHLKETLAKIFESLNKAVSKVDEEFKGVYARFENNQMRRFHDGVIFGIYKAKNAALFFNKPDNDLLAEITSANSKLAEVLNGTVTTRKNLELEELRHAFAHISTLAARCTYKLCNWIDVNADDSRKSEMEQINLVLSGLFHEINSALMKNLSNEMMKERLFVIYTGALDLAKRASQLKVDNNLGSPEFIRSCIVDAVTIGHAYGDNLKQVLA